MDFKKFPGETDEAYVMRVCSHKADIGRWGEVAAILNEELNQNLCEDAYRKQYKKATAKPFESDGFEVSGTTECTMPECVTEEMINKQKLAADKLEINRFVRQQSRFELFYDKVKDEIKKMPPPSDMVPVNFSASNIDYVLTVADIHYGSVFVSQNNTYNREIATQRMQQLLGKIIDFTEKNNVAHLNIVGLGDDIEGILRMSDLILNDIAVTECVVEVSRLWASFLNTLSKYVCIDFYAVSSSNHTQTRPLGSKASELAGEDVEKIINSYIHDVLADNPRITVHADMTKDYIAFKVFDFDMVALHGHQLKNLESAMKDVSQLHQKFYDYMFVGHWHSSREITVGERGEHNVEILQSPAIMGGNPYSDKIMKGAKAAAKLYEFDQSLGHIGSKTFILN